MNRDLETCGNVTEGSNIHIIGVPEGKEKVGLKRVFIEIMAESILNLAKDTNLQIQETK